MPQDQTSTESTVPLTADGILDSLNEDTNKLPDKTSDSKDEIELPAEDDAIPVDIDDEDTSQDSEESEKTDDNDDDESEVKEIELKEEDELEYKDIPKRQEILKAYPDIFKKFPGVEKAIYREQAYSEIFPTLADAKQANERLGTLRQFEGDLLNGNIERVLKSVKDTNGDAFGRITGGILQTLHKVDEGAYYNTLNFVLKNALSTANFRARETGDEQLEIASQLLHKFIYGSTEVTPPEIVQEKRPDPREQQLNQRERQFASQQLDIAVKDVSTRTDNVIKSAVDKHIDPKNIMTPYVRAKATEDVLRQINKDILGDARFVAIKDKLWEVAMNDNFSETSKVKIRNALLSKAKTILPGIIQKVKADALKGQATKSRSASESKDDRPLSAGKSASPNKSSKDPKSIDRNMKTLDYLMQD